MLERLCSELVQDGNRNFDLGRYDAAIDEYRNALDIAMKINEHLTASVILSALATVYAKVGKIELATNYYQDAARTISDHRSRDANLAYPKLRVSLKELPIEHLRIELLQEELYGIKRRRERVEQVERGFRRIEFVALAATLLLLIIALSVVAITKNPLTLVGLQIPVVFFYIVSYGNRLRGEKTF